MRKNKSRAPQRKEDFQLDKVLVAKFIAVVIAVSLAIAVYQNLRKSEYFRVSAITVRNCADTVNAENNFAYLKGRNIFDLDLDKETRHAAYYYPSYQKVRITRFFPSHLVVDFLKREPLAVIRASRVFFIDDNLILFELPDDPAGRQVPLITGVDRYVDGAKYGSRCNAASVAAALDIIRGAARNKIIRGYKIKRLDMSASAGASIFLVVSAPARGYTEESFIQPEQMLEIKIGRDNTADKLAILATLLAQVKNNIYNIEYIDLRFKEPVIKFKEKG